MHFQILLLQIIYPNCWGWGRKTSMMSVSLSLWMTGWIIVPLNHLHLVRSQSRCTFLLQIINTPVRVNDIAIKPWMGNTLFDQILECRYV
jgi:hypothetical protein